jgi:hypothetical protein
MRSRRWRSPAAIRAFQFFERFSDCILQNARAVSVQRNIDMFEPADEIDHIAAHDWSAGRGAKMRATSKRSRFVNQAIARFSLKHWAPSISILWKRFPASGAKRFGCEQRFAFRQIRSAAGQFEMATLGLAQAISLDRSLRKIDIYISHFVERDPDLFGAFHNEVGSTPAMACPAIHPVVQAA